MSFMKTRAVQALRDAEAYRARLDAKGGTATPAELAVFKDKVELAGSLLQEAKQSAGLEQLTAGMTLAGGPVGDPFGSAAVGGGHIGGGIMERSLGTLFVESEGYREAAATGLKASRWSTGPIELGLEQPKTTLTSDTGSGGYAIQPQVLPGIVPLPLPVVRVADLLPSGTTSSNTVRYVRESTFTDAADTVAEGAAKPKAHWCSTRWTKISQRSRTGSR